MILRKQMMKQKSENSCVGLSETVHCRWWKYIAIKTYSLINNPFSTSPPQMNDPEMLESNTIYIYDALRSKYYSQTVLGSRLLDP